MFSLNRIQQYVFNFTLKSDSIPFYNLKHDFDIGNTALQTSSNDMTVTLSVWQMQSSKAPSPFTWNRSTFPLRIQWSHLRLLPALMRRDEIVYTSNERRKETRSKRIQLAAHNCHEHCSVQSPLQQRWRAFLRTLCDRTLKTPIGSNNWTISLRQCQMIHVQCVGCVHSEIRVVKGNQWDSGVSLVFRRNPRCKLNTIRCPPPELVNCVTLRRTTVRGKQ